MTMAWHPGKSCATAASHLLYPAIILFFYSSRVLAGICSRWKEEKTNPTSISFLRRPLPPRSNCHVTSHADRTVLRSHLSTSVNNRVRHDDGRRRIGQGVGALVFRSYCGVRSRTPFHHRIHCKKEDEHASETRKNEVSLGFSKFKKLIVQFFR